MCIERFAPLEFVIWGATYLIQTNNKITTDTGESMRRERLTSFLRPPTAATPLSLLPSLSSLAAAAARRSVSLTSLPMLQEGGRINGADGTGFVTRRREGCYGDFLSFSLPTPTSSPSPPLLSITSVSDLIKTHDCSFIFVLSFQFIFKFAWLVFIFYFFYFLPLSSSGKPTWLSFHFYPLISKRT